MRFSSNEGLIHPTITKSNVKAKDKEQKIVTTVLAALFEHTRKR